MNYQPLRTELVISLYPSNDESVNAHFIYAKVVGNKTTYICHETTVDGDDVAEKEHERFIEALGDLYSRIEVIHNNVHWVDVL